MADPTSTDPDKYKVLFENERVRVLEYRDEPGQRTSSHDHPDSVMITLSGFGRRLMGDTDSRDVTLAPGEVRWLDAQTHSGENIGDTPTHVVFLELKEPGEVGSVDALGPGMIENTSVPAAPVIPVLTYPKVGVAVDWLCAAFGFRVRLRIGDHRAQLVSGDGAVIVVHGSDRPAGHSVHVRVADADAHHDRAVDAGASVVSAPTDYPFGERQYTAEDHVGRRWTFSQSIADVHPANWGGTLVDDG